MYVHVHVATGVNCTVESYWCLQLNSLSRSLQKRATVIPEVGIKWKKYHMHIPEVGIKWKRFPHAHVHVHT